MNIYHYFVVYDYADGGRGNAEVHVDKPITIFQNIKDVEKWLAKETTKQEIRITNFTLLRTESDNG